MKYQVRETTGWVDSPRSELFDTYREAEERLKEIEAAEERHPLFKLYIYVNKLK